MRSQPKTIAVFVPTGVITTPNLKYTIRIPKRCNPPLSRLSCADGGVTFRKGGSHVKRTPHGEQEAG